MGGYLIFSFQLGLQGYWRTYLLAILLFGCEASIASSQSRPLEEMTIYQASLTSNQLRASVIRAMSGNVPFFWQSRETILGIVPSILLNFTPHQSPDFNINSQIAEQLQLFLRNPDLIEIAQKGDFGLKGLSAFLRARFHNSAEPLKFDFHHHIQNAIHLLFNFYKSGQGGYDPYDIYFEHLGTFYKQKSGSFVYTYPSDSFFKGYPIGAQALTVFLKESEVTHYLADFIYFLSALPEPVLKEFFDLGQSKNPLLSSLSDAERMRDTTLVQIIIDRLITADDRLTRLESLEKLVARSHKFHLAKFVNGGHSRQHLIDAEQDLVRHIDYLKFRNEVDLARYSMDQLAAFYLKHVDYFVLNEGGLVELEDARKFIGTIAVHLDQNADDDFNAPNGDHSFELSDGNKVLFSFSEIVHRNKSHTLHIRPYNYESSVNTYGFIRFVILLSKIREIDLSIEGLHPTFLKSASEIGVGLGHLGEVIYQDGQPILLSKPTRLCLSLTR